MIIMSEITGGKYKTVDECLAAEKAFLDKKAAEEKAKAEKQKKINDAYDKAIKACEEDLKLVGIDDDFIEDDKSNGKTATKEKDEFDEILEILESFFEQERKDGSMTNTDKLLQLEVRLKKLKSNERNVDSPGVILKLERQIRNLKRQPS